MSRETDRRRRLPSGVAVLAALLVLAAAGCSGARKGAVPPPDAAGAPAADNAAAVAEVIPPAIPIAEEQPPVAKTEPAPVPEAAPRVPEGKAAGIPGGEAQEARKDAAVPKDSPDAPVKKTPSTPEKQAPRAIPETPASKKAKVETTPEPSSPVRPAPAPVPAWTRQKETLAYRVDFIGITMGYARFRYQGKVTIAGKEAYHLNVRAWTSGILSYIYPINETIDYYLDAGTIEPIRVEYTGRQNKPDDVTHDPVSAAYFFRSRGMNGGEKERNVYGGRKVYQIAARFQGGERLHTDRGEIDTLVVRPVIRRDGKLEDKGDLRMWVSNDERLVPVRFYAKFRKIKEWTLVGELLPERAGG
ncbi:MAG: ATP-dependent exonuclease [Deltaproteobacteria bacterium]|nr:ATP-dependent exonuclease [Deltaproteobacteria bacterium]